MNEEQEEVTAEGTEFDTLLQVAQVRDEDPDGDPDALDLEAAEEPADEDPPPVMNDDCDDCFDDLEEGEDLGDDWDTEDDD